MANKKYAQVKSILVSQPHPDSDKSPYFDLAKKHNLQIDFRPFIEVEPVPTKDFRKSKITITDYSSVIFNSRNAVDNFFRICEDLRIKMPQTTKYFCITESIALYLQKYILYRKRKVFFGNGTLEDLQKLIIKYKETEKYLLPCSNVMTKESLKVLEKNKVDFKVAVMYKTISSDLSDLKDLTYDAIIFFSPAGLKSLFENFPDFKQNNTRIGGFGPKTAKAIKEAGLTLNIKAPTKNAPSMTMAIEKYVEKANR